VLPHDLSDFAAPNAPEAQGQRTDPWWFAACYSSRREFLTAPSVDGFYAISTTTIPLQQEVLKEGGQSEP
jgi:hypothetical protein